ncbi:hypothetical protein [Peribacillus frigoritolerans]|nr:hypothetical protein [Peribacillus frigoritolerans]
MKNSHGYSRWFVTFIPNRIFKQEWVTEIPPTGFLKPTVVTV